MKKLITISYVLILGLFSQNTFGQEKKHDEKLEYKSDQIKRSSKDQTIYLTGNVKLKSKNLILENAEKVTIDEKNSIITIYNPKDYKLISAKTLSKNGKTNKNIIVYDTKEESISFH